MSRIVLDTTGANYAAVRDIPCLKLGYLNGPESAWTAEQIGEQHKRRELLAVIDVLGDAPHQAAIVDWEREDVQDPNRLRWWIHERNSRFGDAVAYCNRDGMPGVLGAMHGTGEYFQLLVADLTSNGEPPLAAPDFGLPPNVRLLGVQYAWPATTGGPYDLSILFNDAWHADVAPVHLVRPAAAAPAVSTPTEGPGNLQGADPKAPDPAAAAAGPTSYAPQSQTWPGAFTPPPTQGTATAPLPQVLAAGTGPDGAATPATPAPEPAIARPYVPPPAAAAEAITDATADGWAAQPTAINHDAVRRWILDGRKIASVFRDAGASHAADQLEQILAQTLEVGQLLAAAGK